MHAESLAVHAGRSESLEGTRQPIFGTRTVYDGNGCVRETQRLTGLSIAVDAAGQSVVTQNGQIVHRSLTKYDSQGRVVETVAPDGQITNYEYDSQGRRTAQLGHPQRASTVGLIVAGDPLVRLRSETVYDSQGQVSQEITNIRQYASGIIDRSAQQVTSYRYNAAGLVREVKKTAAGSDATALLPKVK